MGLIILNDMNRSNQGKNKSAQSGTKMHHSSMQMSGGNMMMHGNKMMDMGNLKQKFWISLVLALPILFLSPAMGISLPFQFSFNGSELSYSFMVANHF